MKDLVKDEYYQIKAKKGVILTTGGYSANVELLKEWNPLSLKKNVYNDSPRSNSGKSPHARLRPLRFPRLHEE